MKKREIIIIACILVLSILAYLVIELTKKPGDIVIVKIYGKVVAEYPLNENGVFEINGGTNILHIEEGYAWISDANCPDKVCVKEGRISKDGETISCKPNGVTILVDAEESFIDLEG